VIITIDPGVHEAGVAIWRPEGVLFEAYLVRVRKDQSWLWMVCRIREELHGIAITEIVIERPQIYVHSRSKGDPNDLITLALMAGATVGALTRDLSVTVTEYLPAQWKGQVPKQVMTKRIKRALTDEEHTRVTLPKARGLAHNVWDAIGIGLHHLRGKRRARNKTT